MKKILILGNGLSRLEPDIDKFIKSWKGEIWVSNGAYREAIELPNISRVNGHKECLIAAYQYKIKYHFDYNCYVQGVITKKNKDYADNVYYGVPLIGMTTLGGLKTDSGTGWVICAIKEGYDEIYCAGFDLKGTDIYTEYNGVPYKYKIPKSSWMKKWRIINNKFGLDKIIFLGKDHKEFIRSTCRDF